MLIPVFITLFFWVTFVIYWVVNIYRINKKTFIQEIQGFLSLAGTAVIVYLPIHFWILGNKVLPGNTKISIIGVLVCGVGILFAVWAREFLGKNWSAAITLQKEHQLIKNGPYGIVRHPMYTGLLLGLIGSSIVIGAVWGFLVTILLILGIIGKIKGEEKLLLKNFPKEYPSYKQKVKALMPFIW